MNILLKTALKLNAKYVQILKSPPPPPFMSRKVIQNNYNKKHPIRYFGASCLKTCKSTIPQSILYSVPRIIALNLEVPVN
jgi:hypothetical protein